MRDLQRRSFPVFTTTAHVDMMHEADVFAINGTEYMWEFEIKTSRGDFKGDFKKKRKHHYLSTRFAFKRKYLKDKNGKRTKEWRPLFYIPNRFYYVCEEGMIEKNEVPEYAGLIYVTKKGEYKEQKRAPLLHKEKATKEVYQQAARIVSQRIIYGCSFERYKFEKLKCDKR